MAKRQTMEEEINALLEVWDVNSHVALIEDIMSLFRLYDVDDQEDWVRDEVGDDNVKTVRLLRTVYLVSRIADSHAGKLCLISMKFKGLWKRMKEQVDKDKADSK